MVAEERLASIREQIDIAAREAGRDPSDVTLIGAAKYTETLVVESFVKAGLSHIAENYVQNANRWKNHELRNKIHLHMIGHLQGNKVKPALKSFDSIDTVDSIKLANRIDHLAESDVAVMIEVNISEEDSKHGCPVAKFPQLVDHIITLNHIRLNGVFTMCPIDATGKTRKNIYNQAEMLASGLEQRLGRSMDRSYGMSDDYKLAIECKATQIRLGRALFGGV